MMMMKRALVVLAFLLAAPVWGQTCTTASCSAATCAQSDVMAALPASGNTNATVTVTIPSCPSGTAWTASDSYMQPSAVTTLIVQGQTTCTGSGDPASNNLSCTDGTVIEDSLSGSNPALTWSVGTGQFLRLTGITLEPGSRSGGGDHGTMVFQCTASGSQLRLDHSHFENIGTMMTTQDCFGVMDHNSIQETNGTSNWLHIWNPFYNQSTSSGNGDGSWATATQFGSSNFFVIEQNAISNGVDDCTFGGRVVARFNSFTNGGSLQTHPTGGGGADERGCRAYEIYGNTFLASNASPAFNAFWESSGTALFWGNTSTAGYKYGINLHSMRRDNSTYTQTATPNGWGYCGTSFDGTGSAWDQNTSTTTGYACIDQPGRGKGDLITGVAPSWVNSTTGTISWVHEALEPIYEWSDTWTVAPGSGGVFVNNTNEPEVLTSNQDFYLWCNASSPAGCTSAFNGTVGTGSGTLASRSSTCTTGVAYWATDQGSWNSSGNGFGNGQLSICTATNTWTNSYTPRAYPDPLEGGSSSFSLTITATNGSVSGTNCANGSYASGTSIGTCTATPNAGYSFTGWSSTGSSSCSGTGTCGPFSITANTTLTAAFTINTYTLGITATNGSVSGTNCTAGTYNYNTAIGACSATPSAGYTFTGWSGTGSCSGASGTGTASCTLTSNSTLTASFSLTTPPPAAPQMLMGLVVTK